MDGLMFAVLLLAVMALYAAVVTEDEKVVEFASMTVIVVVLLALLVWFVFYLPAPDYMPGYGSDPRNIPYQMKD